MLSCSVPLALPVNIKSCHVVLSKSLCARTGSVSAEGRFFETVRGNAAVTWGGSSLTND